MEQTETPFFDALVAYWHKGVVPYHTPGHKQGRGAPRRLRETVGNPIFALDLSELEAPALDDDPEEVLHRAQRLASQAFGSDYTFFLTNGTTEGIHAMLMATLHPGEQVILARNVHRSVVAGLVLSGAAPIYVEPSFHPQLAIPTGLTPESVHNALAANPKVRAMLITYPSYYGLASDLGSTIHQASEHGVVVLVDEAHGPHLHFHPALPPSAMDLGADASAQSAHKLLGSFSGSSFLHIRERRISIRRVKTALRLIGSTSPSFLLLASLDCTRQQMALEGEQLLERTLALAQRARSAINAIPGLYCPGQEIVGSDGVAAYDPTKILVSVGGLGWTGAAAERYLRRNCGLQCELSDALNLLFLITIGDDDETVDRLVEGLRRLAAVPPPAEVRRTLANLRHLLGEQRPQVPPLRLLPREAVFAPQRPVPLQNSVGEICAEVLAPYPPGVPVICPGEEITAEAVEYLRAVKRAGISIPGAEDHRLETVKVVNG
ncbi:MAG: aminotransferase class V-fold PLP-dependent enzyme [Firmicutes bacterium]|nr:aminotransferase class V-fold PLP-dependent enzyme [Bacillota bacterium]